MCSDNTEMCLFALDRKL